MACLPASGHLDLNVAAWPGLDFQTVVPYNHVTEDQLYRTLFGTSRTGVAGVIACVSLQRLGRRTDGNMRYRVRPWTCVGAVTGGVDLFSACVRRGW